MGSRGNPGILQRTSSLSPLVAYETFKDMSKKYISDSGGKNLVLLFNWDVGWHPELLERHVFTPLQVVRTQYISLFGRLLYHDLL
ncbi:hypothetical protein PanWU01x14_335870 [Parasponia andersonii]|uniref:Uncharacterized protein n=1 Tax=Parasponia andersonii TaxID=3476 RepID=A0A2P5AG31_PARAD|nr:hypothetical protein PanWU01x14_335870 [Parasponia andersonii]